MPSLDQMDLAFGRMRRTGNGYVRSFLNSVHVSLTLAGTYNIICNRGAIEAEHLIAYTGRGMVPIFGKLLSAWWKATLGFGTVYVILDVIAGAALIGGEMPHYGLAGGVYTFFSGINARAVPITALTRVPKMPSTLAWAQEPFENTNAQLNNVRAFEPPAGEERPVAEEEE